MAAAGGTMDFFGAQERARRNTGRLVLLFAAAVVTICLAVYFAAVVALRVADADGGEQQGLWRPEVFMLAGGGTLLVVGLATLHKVAQLRSGGRAVAELLGGRRISAGTDDPAERRLFNVVEEMSIASGVPMPDVYVMDGEAGINAFAAGYTPDDAAVTVTAACVQQLGRDELQGVIAHEFSHVLNGDMRLNIRLMGVLFGITCITTAGYLVLRSVGHSRSSNRKGGGAGPILAFAIALLVIGWLGSLFAKMIKAAVSRQREFLADAAAVQFTRNPAGLSGALQRIAGAAAHGRIANAHAVEASHMFFADGVGRALASLFATHPPLADRIRALEPWKARFPQPPAAAAKPASARGAGEATAARPDAGPAPAGPLPRIPGLDKLPIRPEILLGAIGSVDARQLQTTRQWLDGLPLALTTAIHEPLGAQAVVFCMLLDDDAEVRRRQLRSLGAADPAVQGATVELARLVRELPAGQRLPLLDLCMPALRAMSKEQFARFDAEIRDLIAADERVTLFEYCLGKILHRRLEGHFHKIPLPAVRHRDLSPVRGACGVVLSAVARAGGDADRAAEAYAAGIEGLPVGTDGQPAPELRARLSTAELDAALTELQATAPAAKRDLIAAACRVVAADGEARVEELELMRAIADTLDVPVPPLGLAAAGPTVKSA